MKALVTGITGFVGRYLSEYLLSMNIQVWGTVLKSESLYDLSKDVIIRKLDITNKQQFLQVLQECSPDLVFHLAAQSSTFLSWKNPNLTMDINLNGTINLLESVRELNINPKILLIGSSEEYGYINIKEIPVNEQQPLRPGNPYSVSKIAQTLLGQVYARAYNLNIVMVRAFNHIGPKQSPLFVASDFAKRIVEIEKKVAEPILYVGNLEAERDFTDVRDVVRAYYELTLKGKKGEIYNVGSGKSYKIRHLLEMLLSFTDVKIEIRQDPNKMRPSDVPIIRCDNSKLIKETNWKIKYSLKDSLQDIIEYWRMIV